MATTERLWSLIAPYLDAERLDLDDLEWLGVGKGRTLRVVVDGAAVDLVRLSELSRGIGRLLDAEADIGGSYQLELTSPGLERKLRHPSHWMKSIGREVVVKVLEGKGRRTLQGRLIKADETTFSVELDGEVEVHPYDEVSTAKTVFRWEASPRPGR